MATISGSFQVQNSTTSGDVGMGIVRKMYKSQQLKAEAFRARAFESDIFSE